MTEQRTGAADPERLRVLKEGLAACAADQLALKDTAPREGARAGAR
ncbi:hypothetical protein AB8O64_36185 (plasmid) [Streptomyces sp. QH1-20]